MFKNLKNRFMIDKTVSPVEKKDGFLFFINNIDEYTIYPNSLVFDPKNISKTIKYINEKNIKSIMFNSFYFKSIDDISFLNEILEIESISIQDDKIDLSPINHLKKLKRLHFDETKQEIDLNNFPDLRIIGGNYSKKILNIARATNLEWIYLHNYNKEDLKDFIFMKNLKFLHLNNTNIKNLIGLDYLSFLQDLDIEKAPRLDSLCGLCVKNSSLTKISIFNAKILTDLKSIENIENLEFLWLKKIPDVKNLNFLKNSKRLNNFCLGAKLIEKEFSQVKNVKDIFIPGYKGNTMK